MTLPGRHACSRCAARRVKTVCSTDPSITAGFLLLTIGAQLISYQKPKPLHSRGHERCARATRAMLVKGSLVEGFC